MSRWDAIIDAEIEAQLAQTAGGTNHDIYEKRLTAIGGPIPRFDKVPRCIYFYYVRIDRDGKVRVDHYLYVKRNPDGTSAEIPYADVPRILYDLAINARPRTHVKDPPKDRTNNFDPIPWKYRSYIAIFFDEANWQFCRRQNGLPAVVFDADLGKANNSFFDAADVMLDMPIDDTTETDERSAVYFINHVKRNSDGDPLEDGEEQNFKFDMWLSAAFANTSTAGMRVIFDPGGTNQGPPQDPP